MRIIFKRPAKFPLRDDGFTKLYEPEVEHDIQEDTVEQIRDSLLFKQLRGSGGAVIVKDTAPTQVEVENQRKRAEAEQKRKDAEDAAAKKVKEEKRVESAEQTDAEETSTVREPDRKSSKKAK